jgi:hypothetical protein
VKKSAGPPAYTRANVHADPHIPDMRRHKQRPARTLGPHGTSRIGKLHAHTNNERCEPEREERLHRANQRSTEEWQQRDRVKQEQLSHAYVIPPPPFSCAQHTLLNTP